MRRGDVVIGHLLGFLCHRRLRVNSLVTAAGDGIDFVVGVDVAGLTHVDVLVVGVDLPGEATLVLHALVRGTAFVRGGFFAVVAAACKTMKGDDNSELQMQREACIGRRKKD